MASKMPLMDWKHEPIVDSFRAFKARMNLFLADHEVTAAKKQATKIQIALGDEGMRRILTSGLTADEQEKPDSIWELIASQVDVSAKISFRVHRLELANMKQKSGENITDYIPRLREKAGKCEFTPAELDERLIEMVILSTPFEDFRKDLLKAPKAHPIATVITKGREYEAIQASQASLRSMLHNIKDEATNIDAMVKSPSTKKKCFNCGLHHAFKSCPAYNDECHGCGGMGHWVKCCRKTKRRQLTNAGKPESDKTQPKPRNTHRDSEAKPKSTKTRDQHDIVFGNYEDEYQYQVYHSITSDNVKIDTVDDNQAVFATLQAYHKSPHVLGPLRLKVDTGASGNTLPIRTYRQMFGDMPTRKWLTPEPHTKLTAYSGDTIPCLGSIEIGIRKKAEPEYLFQKFYVVDVQGPAILGLPSCKKLNIVDIRVDCHTISDTKPMNNQPDLTRLQKAKPKVETIPPDGTILKSVDELRSWFPDVFDGIGCFAGEEELHVQEGANPFIDPPRKCPIHIRDKIKAGLDNMEEFKIIRPVTKPTEWCSSLTYAVKKDGSLRLCLDPQKLNKALVKRPHKIPTIEEITPMFAKAKFFTKLDAKSGYWGVKLAPASQELTTFRTPFGRYCFLRLPFGLSISQDAFQEHMDRITNQCKGCTGISDDIVIFGKSEAEHDQNLIEFLKVARKEGLMLNSSKCVVKTTQIAFFGCGTGKISNGFIWLVSP